MKADRLLEFTLRDGRSALVYVLLEHESSVDFGTLLQLLGSMVKIWQRHRSRPPGGRLRLPPIIPLVFRHGKGRWTVPPSVLAMIDAPEPLLAFARSLEYVLVDLGEIPFGRLASDPLLQAALGLLKFASRGQLPPEALDLLVEALVGLPPEDSLLNTSMEYFKAVFRPRVGETAGVSLQYEPRTKEYLMATLVERLLQKGKAEGKAETLLRLLMLRFGAIPDAVKARVRAAVGADLDAWLDAILEAPNLELVFASPEARGEVKGKAEVLLRLLMRRFGAVPDAVKARVRAAVGADLDAWLDAILEAPDLESVFASSSVN